MENINFDPEAIRRAIAKVLNDRTDEIHEHGAQALALVDGWLWKAVENLSEEGRFRNPEKVRAAIAPDVMTDEGDMLCIYPISYADALYFRKTLGVYGSGLTPYVQELY